MAIAERMIARVFCLNAGRFRVARTDDRRAGAQKHLTRMAQACYRYGMEERFYREQEIARLPDFLPAATYNLAHTLLARAGKCLFVPIRSMQYLAVLDAEEFIFVDSQNRAWVELAWQHFRPQTRSALDERVPFEVVHYLPTAAETMKRLPAEFHQALKVLAQRNLPHEDAHILPLLRPPRPE
jgi:hypothetical protein